MIVNPAKLDAAFYTFDLSFRQGLETVVSLYPKICKQTSSPSRLNIVPLARARVSVLLGEDCAYRSQSDRSAAA